MDDKLTTIKFHGELGKAIGREIWKLSVNSVSEAMKAVQEQTKKLYTNLIENDKKNIKYRVLINGKDFVHDTSKNINELEGVEHSELVLKRDLETIDVIPIIEGAGDSFGDVFTTIIGAVLVVASFFVAGPMGAALLMAGIGLMAAGIANLLTPMPEFEDFRQIEGGGRPSYLFTGPANTVREGGPVFVGYGRLLVGSHVIQSSIETKDQKNGNYMNRSADKLTFVPFKNYWGYDGYGLDYGNNLKDKSGNPTLGDTVMKTRAEQVSKSDGAPDECDPTNNYVSSTVPDNTIIVSNGDDYITVGNEIKIEAKER